MELPFNLDELLFSKEFNPEVGIRKSEDIVRMKEAELKPANHILVIDCDECLLNINDKWMRKALELPLADYGISEETILNIFNILNEGYSVNLRLEYPLTSLFDEEVTPEFDKVFHDLYFKDPHFYDDLPDSPFTTSLKAIMENTLYISEIHVLSKVGKLDDPVNESKRRRLDAIFSDYRNRFKIEYHFIEKGELKSDYIKRKFPLINMYVDDSYENIKDVVMNCENTMYNIYVPAYMYNWQCVIPYDKEFFKALDEKAISLQGFHNFEQPQCDQEFVKAYISEALQELDPLGYKEAQEAKANQVRDTMIDFIKK